MRARRKAWGWVLLGSVGLLGAGLGGLSALLGARGVAEAPGWQASVTVELDHDDVDSAVWVDGQPARGERFPDGMMVETGPGAHEVAVTRGPERRTWKVEPTEAEPHLHVDARTLH